MKNYSNLLLRQSRHLFTNIEEQEKFIESLTHPQRFNPCLLWCKEKPESSPFSIEVATPWQPQFIDRLSPGEKPGQHSLHEQGYFYCLDFSSVFAASILLAIPQPINTVFDMCAAPGGKSVFAWKSLQPNLLIANEVINKRLGMLISNLKRCEIKPSLVTSKDLSFFADMMPLSCELAIVDAPCTGQSLLAKGEKAPGCFHPTAINKSANRQKRIIANSARLVSPQGYLAYMTCTYSSEENEEVGEWFLQRFPQFKALEVKHLEGYQSHLSNLPCYRMFPQDGLGAGAFTMLFQNTEEGEGKVVDVEVVPTVWQNTN